MKWGLAAGLGVLGTLAALALAVPGDAAHYAGGTIFVERVDDDTVRLDITTVWTLSEFDGPIVVGAVIPLKPATSSYLKFGDGQMWSVPDDTMRLKVVSVHLADDLFVAKVVNAGGSPITHDYAPGLGAIPVRFDTSFRLNAVRNNPNTAARLQAVIQDGVGDGDDFPPMPRIKHPIIVVCGADHRCRFNLEASIDEAGTPLKARFSTSAEANFDPSAFYQPGPPFGGGPSTMSPSGEFEWDTTGVPPSLYTMHATVETDKGLRRSAGIDLLIRLVEAVDMRVTFTEQPTAGPAIEGEALAAYCNGTEFMWPAGRPLLAHVSAHANAQSPGSPSHDASMTASSLPVGATFTSNGPGVEVTGQLEWLSPRPGRYQVSISAAAAGNNTVRDGLGVCAVNITILGGPQALHDHRLDFTVGERHHFILLDLSTFPPHLEQRNWTWRVDGGIVGYGPPPSFSAMPGEHETCLEIRGTFQGQVYSDTHCLPLRVIATVEDHDRDGVADTSDNCPGTPNRAQLDVDGDGIGDACDHAPREPSGMRRVASAPGDEDGDGHPDAVDNCPTWANPLQEDLDRDGWGDGCDADLDGDFVDQAGHYAFDNCPYIPNPDQRDSDGDGIGDACQGAAPAPDGVDSAYREADAHGVVAREVRSQWPFALGMALLSLAALGLVVSAVTWQARR